MLALLILAVAGTGMPVVEVHEHDDAAFGHRHDVHVHSHDPSGTQSPEGTDDDAPHAHILGSVAVAVTSSFDVDIAIPAWSCSDIPAPASRPPDKPVAPLYRPPIA